MINRFNLRVYGVCIQEGKLLLTDEIRGGMKMTKLPGGGLEFGEGLAACLQREWKEELQADIEVGEIIYVNPFLQSSVFRKEDEVICFYFWVSPTSELKGTFTTQPYDFPNHEDGQQVFRWASIEELKLTDFTFPIDRAMFEKLLALLEK